MPLLKNVLKIFLFIRKETQEFVLKLVTRLKFASNLAFVYANLRMNGLEAAARFYFYLYANLCELINSYSP